MCTNNPLVKLQFDRRHAGDWSQAVEEPFFWVSILIGWRNPTLCRVGKTKYMVLGAFVRDSTLRVEHPHSCMQLPNRNFNRCPLSFRSGQPLDHAPLVVVSVEAMFSLSSPLSV